LNAISIKNKIVLINSDSGHNQITQGGGRSLNGIKLKTGGPLARNLKNSKAGGKKYNYPE